MNQVAKPMTNIPADIAAELAALKAENERLKAAQPKPKSLSIKISENTGAICVSGLNARYPVTLYADQWVKLASFMPTVLEYVATNEKAIAEAVAKAPRLKAPKVG